MLYILIPVGLVAIIAVLCLNVKAGLMVSEATQATGFDFGFYMMTAIGLMAAEISLGVCLFRAFA